MYTHFIKKKVETSIVVATQDQAERGSVGMTQALESVTHARARSQTFLVTATHANPSR